MVEGFKVEVPITLKGGREGEKVGKQIGDKIAAQLNKVFRAVNIGGRTGGAGIGETAGLMGVSKGLKGVALKLGIIGVALAGLTKILAKSSPYLKGILDIFGRAFMIFFRPFGDFLAVLLRPFAILMMRMAVAFLKFTRSPIAKVAEEVVKDQFLNIGPRLGLIPETILKLLKNIDFIKLKEFGSWLWGKVTSAFQSIGEAVKGAGSFLIDALISMKDAIVKFVNSLIPGKRFDLGGDGKSTSSISKSIVGQSSSDILATIPTGSIKEYLATGGPGGGPVPPGGIPAKGLNQISINNNLQVSGDLSKGIDFDDILRKAAKETEMALKRWGIA